MARVLITGMSGTGKSAALAELARRGFETVDADTEEWCEWTADAWPPGGPAQPGWLWRADEMRGLLARPRRRHLFLSGCVSNQGEFYPLFDAVVLFTAPLDVILGRVAARSNNQYGKSAAERAEISEYFHSVVPLLRRRATTELDTSALTVAEVADRLEALAEARGSG